MKPLITIDDVEAFRPSTEATQFAQQWMAAQRDGDVTSDFHMNLIAWTLTDPLVALGLLMTLIDLAGEDDELAEAIAMGPVDWYVSRAPADSREVFDQAIQRHPGLEVFTRGSRESSS